jgi:(p)ppGpp synthase/HD superfamily hydrolase
MVRELTPTIPSTSEDWTTFEDRIADFSTQDQLKISFAYDRAKLGHNGQFRKSGERFFEHPRAVSIILLDECGIKDADIIVAALCHDLVEDTEVVSKDGLTFSQWKELTRLKVSKMFGEQATEMIMADTKPWIDGVEILSKEQMMKEYHSQLEACSEEALLVKMADRLHNLRTLGAQTPEKQKEIIEETRVEYFPLFERALLHYPAETSYMLSQMLDVIREIEP